MQRHGRYGGLDAIRGLAAMGVVLFHYNFLTMGMAPFGTVLGPVYQAGHYLVDLFFVLSGYLLATVYADKRDFPALVWRRIARLVPLHWATLITMVGLRVLMSDAGLTLPDANGDAYHFVLNLLLLNQVGLQHGFSFNTPSWSISVEWITNLALFAAIACGVRRLLWPALALVAASIVLLLHYRGYLSSVGLILGFLDAALLRGMIGFFMGVALASLLPIPPIAGGHRRFLWDLVFIAAAAAILACMGSERFRTTRGLDFLLPVVMMPALIAASMRGRIAAVALSLAPLRFLGEISYSVYLIHFPMLVLLMLVSVWSGIPNQGQSPLQLAAFLVATLGASYLSWRFFEVPMQSWLNRCWRPAPSPGAAITPPTTTPGP